MDYKNTLNLPETQFPMKADLPKREPDMLAHWQKINLYRTIRTQRQGQKKFILHDGPPYANANIHMGTALNKTLKDIVVKAKTLSGLDAPYVPGWDCHGLPIELNVEKKHGKVGEKLSPTAFREACRIYATTQVALQKADFERLGVLGDWEHPYLTMQPAFEAETVRALATMVKKGHLQRGQKPVHWCTACGSALAEAEVEYQDKQSPAVIVGFPLVDNDADILIWTTTPWTLPANEAVAVHPEVTYCLVDTHSKKYILAEALVESVMKTLNISDYSVIQKMAGKSLEKKFCRHPFLEKTVPIILGNHVTTEAGTGCVHTAPAHGQDDYVVGQKYQLPMKNPVNAKSCFDEDVPFFAGMHVFKANDPIIKKLRETGHLLHHDTLTHSYPHCWRHKTPLIFRATPQWFISMEQQGLRKIALDEIEKTQWKPAWGEQRIYNMVESRPDWCISRQRAWGIPITLLVHKKTGELHPNILTVMEKAASMIEKAGIDAWHDCDIHALIDDAKQYEKVTDVLDVWFESGVTHACVLAHRPDLSVPADLYLEGSDQHRGWFQSSLLTSVAIRDHAPYKAVLTHGYVVDAQGRKMSKSLGNTVSPAEVIKNYGADVLRLWATSIDHTDDMSISDEILKRCSDTYRRIRNTLRFLLSNLCDFDPATQCLPAEKLVALDAYMIARAALLQKEIIAALDAYQFPVIYQLLHNFCSVTLGGFYLDILKDRLYTSKKTGLPRRSAQTALYYLLEVMVRWLAPITSFTADEVWKFMPGKREASVFLSRWYALEGAANVNENQIAWLIALRDNVNKALETLRADGKIGSGLEAEITLHCNPNDFKTLQPFGNELRFLFIVSDVRLILADSTDEKSPVIVEVNASENTKCERCWHRHASVGKHQQHATICERCIENIEGEEGEIRTFF